MQWLGQRLLKKVAALVLLHFALHTISKASKQKQLEAMYRTCSCHGLPEEHLLQLVAHKLLLVRPCTYLRFRSQRTHASRKTLNSSATSSAKLALA
jgi:hypothetical protein